ncbi:MAG: 30S ribosomal protein S2 [bacterium]|nr:30S ribosomal protein S2 [bacterium]
MSEKDNNNQIVAELDQDGAEVTEELAIDPTVLEDMLRAGVLYGRSKSRTHPKMRKYIEMTRNGIEIFDPSKTLEMLKAAGDFLKDVAKKNGSILLVSTLPASKELVRSLAEKFGFPHVTNRWLGGILTNYKTLSQRLQYYMDLKADREMGKLEKYTKKERFGFDKKIARLTILFGGLEKYAGLPDALLVVDAEEHATAIREANRLNIPVVCLMSSNSKPASVDYVIPCNSGARSGVAWILERLEQALEQGQMEKQELTKIKDAKKPEEPAKEEPAK